MQHPVQSLIESRHSINHYDPDRPVGEHDLQELVRLATLAPSAYNLQNWSFVAVRSAAGKARLKAVCYGQQKVQDAAVTFIVCGTLQAHTTLPRTLQPSVDMGLLPASLAATWATMATQTHANNPGLQRDEAFRSASLAAMTLMLAAQGMGLGSGAMSGFDAEALQQAFELSALEVPVMLVTVGYPALGNWPQKPRRPVVEVLRFA